MAAALTTLTLLAQIAPPGPFVSTQQKNVWAMSWSVPKIPAQKIALAISAVQMVNALAGLGLKYPRYFMPTTLLLLPLVGFGMAVLLRAVWARLPHAVSRPGVHPRPT